MIHFICALHCEAAPLIEHYQLKHVQKAKQFSIYLQDNKQVSLTLSGVGKLAAAAATSYTHSMLQCEADEVWINLGLAGHESHSIGDIYIANRIKDAGSLITWYPQIVIDTSMPSEALLTLDRVSTDYQNCMYDMEAAGFIFSASRFSTSELTHCLKVISDNNSFAATRISKTIARDLVFAVKQNIVEFASRLKSLSLQTRSELDISEDIQRFTQNWHFTQYQKNTLKKLLHRHRLLLPDLNPFILANEKCKDAKAVLHSLSVFLDTTPFSLTRDDV